MHISQFSSDVQKMAFFAQRLANKYGHREILPQHILLAMVQEPGNMVQALIVEAGGDGDTSRLVKILQANLENKISTGTNGRSPSLSAGSNDMFDFANHEANLHGVQDVCCEFVLLAMLNFDDMRDMLATVNVTRKTVEENLEKVRCARTPRPNWW